MTNRAGSWGVLSGGLGVRTEVWSAFQQPDGQHSCIAKKPDSWLCGSTFDAGRQAQ